MTEFGFPYRVGSDGRTASASIDEHVRSLVELVLFTSQGERVNRPDFGAGLRQLIFSENSPELASAVRSLVQGALQKELSGLIEVLGIDTQSDGARLDVQVAFRLLGETTARVIRLPRERQT